MTPCDDDLQMRAQCAFAVMMRMLMMTTGMDALSRGEGGFPALPHETPRPARPSPAQPRPVRPCKNGRNRGAVARQNKVYTVISFQFRKPFIEEFDNTNNDYECWVYLTKFTIMQCKSRFPLLYDFNQLYEPRPADMDPCPTL